MKNKLETVDALQEWGRNFRDKGHPVSLTLFRASAVILTDIQITRQLLEALTGIIGDCASDLPVWRVDEARAAIALASESQREAAGTADEKPDGQAENAESTRAENKS